MFIVYYEWLMVSKSKARERVYDIIACIILHLEILLDQWSCE